MTVGGLLILLLLVSGYTYLPPNPPLPEEGVEISLGNSQDGSGTDAPTSKTQSNYAPPAAQDRVATQRHSAPVSSSETQGDVVNPDAAVSQQPTNKEPELNPNASYKPRQKDQQTGTGTGSGNTTGQTTQGTVDGNGHGQSAGVGGNYTLKGRNAVSLPKPSTTTNKVGTVVVKIRVDWQGRVLNAEYEPKGSNTADLDLQKMAIAAAKKSRFNALTAQAEDQIGYITYHFINQ